MARAESQVQLLPDTQVVACIDPGRADVLRAVAEGTGAACGGSEAAVGRREKIDRAQVGRGAVAHGQAAMFVAQVQPHRDLVRADRRPELAVDVGIQCQCAVVVVLDVAGARLGALVGGQRVDESRVALLHRVVLPAEILLQLPAVGEAVLQLVACTRASGLDGAEGGIADEQAAIHPAVDVGQHRALGRQGLVAQELAVQEAGKYRQVCALAQRDGKRGGDVIVLVEHVVRHVVAFVDQRGDAEPRATVGRQWPAQIRGDLPHAEIAHGHAHLAEGLGPGALAHDVDQPARAYLAEQQRGGALEHLDALGAEDLLGRDVAGTHGVQAVDVLFLVAANVDAADAEIVEAAVAVIAGHHAGHAAQRLDQSLDLGLVESLTRQHGDRLRCLQRTRLALGGAGDRAGRHAGRDRAPHRDRGQFGLLVLGDLRRQDGFSLHRGGGRGSCRRGLLGDCCERCETPDNTKCQRDRGHSQHSASPVFRVGTGWRRLARAVMGYLLGNNQFFGGHAVAPRIIHENHYIL